MEAETGQSVGGTLVQDSGLLFLLLSNGLEASSVGGSIKPHLWASGSAKDSREIPLTAVQQSAFLVYGQET
ncbi:hypothetical protein SKAU_G00302160 [Synaphobranchus kaupii]|uniref:Uncharacterized protein n=1 Tax=Synaphobranchus kaupii TaxID=118154 RepID=A0A9Q1EVY4_SYNKA|nr:hypothetical protein SKAU_G00302160 [Synaphobranchus kaupii]